MIVTLKKLQINNFKGINCLSIDFSEHTRLCGANATGKTSVYDAYLWLLVGKDSMDSASFAIKPREKSGEEKHRIATSVEGVFDVDGEELKLKKPTPSSGQRSGVRRMKTLPDIQPTMSGKAFP